MNDKAALRLGLLDYLVRTVGTDGLPYGYGGSGRSRNVACFVSGPGIEGLRAGRVKGVNCGFSSIPERRCWRWWGCRFRDEVAVHGFIILDMEVADRYKTR